MLPPASWPARPNVFSLGTRLVPYVLAVLVAACNNTPPRTDLPQEHLLHHVPFIAQDAQACGPASLAMVLQYYGQRQTQEQLKPLLLLPERKGTLQIELAAAARREGFLSLQGPSSMDTLLADVAAGFPVIVLQNLRLDMWPQWHFAVVVGFNQEDGVVLLRSGDHALIEVPYHTFQNTWERANRWALIVTPPNRLPPGTTVKTATQAANELAQSGHRTRAIAAYGAITHRWPQDLASWNTLGNLAYEQNRWPISVQAYAQSLARSPTQARLWNNFAYALQQSGCRDQATEALNCALSLAPQDAYLQSSRNELDQMHAGNPGQCGVVISQCRITDKSAPVILLQ